MKLSANGYMVKYPGRNGIMMLAFSDGMSITRRDAINKFRPRLRNDLTWKQAYARGARVVWVRVKEF